VLADAPRGVNEEVLVVAHGFSAEMVSGLVLAGLATVETETRKANPSLTTRPGPRGPTITVVRIRITHNGRKVIEG
jgi:hypothetical protein